MERSFLSIRHLSTLLWLAIICLFTFQMAVIIAPYISWRRDVDFLITKQLIIHLDYYRAAFYAHIFSSILPLFCGAFLFSKNILKHAPVLHRIAGRIYVVTLLLVSAPSGFILAFYANGGWSAKLAFLILTPIWWWCTWQGFQAARKRQFEAHRVYMIRSYALTLSAVSLRIYQMALGSFFHLDPALQYALVSWFAWTGNLAVVEYLIWRSRRSVLVRRQAKGNQRWAIINQRVKEII